MFGIYRYLLTLTVLHTHYQWWMFGRFNWDGIYSVFAFFALSGYLMTRVLHQVYGYGAANFLRFFVNRAMRIYPLYWLALATTALILWCHPDAATDSAKLVYLPQHFNAWLRNAAIVGMWWGWKPTLVLPAWSLHVEVIFYIAMGLGLSSTRRLTLLWFAASVGWTAWAIVSGVDFGWRFSSVTGSSLAFSTGALLYWTPDWRSRWMVVPLIAFIPHAVLASHIWHDVYFDAFYAAFVMVPPSLLWLAGLKPNAAWRRWDDRFADLCYPIFLFHVPVGYLLQVYLPPGHRDFGTIMALGIPITHLVGILLVLLVETPIEKFRKRLRINAAHNWARVRTTADGRALAVDPNSPA